MLICELFDDEPIDIVKRLRGSMLDILTPLAANGVPFVTVNHVIDALRDLQSGISVDRSLVMAVLDPDEVKIVEKIEGDRIYMSLPAPDEVKKRREEEAKDREQLSRNAEKLATKDVEKKQDSPPVPEKPKVPPPKADGPLGKL